MRSHKLWLMSTVVLATTTFAAVSFADDTPSATSPSMSTPTSGSPSTTTGTMTGTAPSSQPTSTTTTTSADDVSAAAPMPPPATAAPASGETTTVYQRRRPNTPMLITGGALLVGTYATTAAVSGANGSVADRDLYLPVVGPWINIADRSSTRENNTRDTILIAGSGVLQGVGVAMLITSFFVPERVPAARISAGNLKMQVAPTASAGGGGVGAFGTF